MKKIFNLNSCYYLVFLIPISYILGIAITEALVFFSIIFFIFKNKSLDYFKNRFFIFLLLFSIYIFINSIFNIDYTDLKLSSIFHFRFILFSVSIIFILDYFEGKSFNLNFIAYLLCIITILIISDSLIQFFFGKNILGFEIIDSRISSIFGKDLVLGSFLLRLLPFFLFFIMYFEFDKINDGKKYIIIFLSLYLISIYISGSRTSFILVLLFLFMIFFFIKEIKDIILKAFIVLSFFIVLTSIFDLGKSNTFNRMFVKTFNQITGEYYSDIMNSEQYRSEQYSFSKEIDEKKNFSEKIVEHFEIHPVRRLLRSTEIFSKVHTGHYTLAYDQFLKKPLFGIGPKGFRNYCRKVDYNPEIGICSTHPHNFFIQITAELGILGFLFYLIILSFIIINIKNSLIKRKSKYQSMFLVVSSSLLINLFPFLPSGNFFNNWISIIIYYNIGLYMFSYKKVFTQ